MIIITKYVHRLTFEGNFDSLIGSWIHFDGKICKEGEDYFVSDNGRFLTFKNKDLLRHCATIGMFKPRPGNLGVTVPVGGWDSWRAEQGRATRVVKEFDGSINDNS